MKTSIYFQVSDGVKHHIQMSVDTDPRGFVIYLNKKPVWIVDAENGALSIFSCNESGETKAKLEKISIK